MHSWTTDDEIKLTKALTIAGKLTNTFGSKAVGDITEGWKWILEEKYTVEQVLCALKQHINTNSTFPTPADINNLLDPPAVEITQAQYVEACKAYAREGYKMFCGHKDTMDAYVKQQAEKQENVDAIKQQAQQIMQHETQLLENY